MHSEQRKTTSARRPGRSRVPVFLAAALVLLAGGCGASKAATLQSEIKAIKVPTPVTHPIFVRQDGYLIARVQNSPRIAIITPNLKTVGDSAPPYKATTRLSAPFKGMGENVGLNYDQEKAFVPLPSENRIIVVDRRTLRPVHSYPATDPEQLSTDVGSKTLLALAENGQTVSGVDLKIGKPIVAGLFDKAPGGPNALIEGPDRGIEPHFWASGNGGIAYYEGHTTPVTKDDSLNIPVKDFVIDEVKDTRAYVAQRGTNRLLAVEVSPSTRNLYVSARKTFNEPIQYVGVDEYRIYVATQNELFVLSTNNFQSLNGSFGQQIETIHYRHPLPSALKNTPLSGIAVSSATSDVYLTLKGKPYVISVHKPTEPLS